MSASVRAFTTYSSDGTTDKFTIPVPPGTPAGDLIIATILVGNVNGYTTDSLPKGWWSYAGGTVNSRQFYIHARIYNPATPAGDYTLTMGAQAAAVMVVTSIRDHGVAASTDVQVGTKWLRGSNGGSSGIVVAPSITTPAADRLVLAVIGEASNALGGYAETTLNGFTKVAEKTEGPTANQSIEWVSVWKKLQAAADATGLLQLTYTPTSLNGVGVQISIPSGVIALPTTGCIGTRYPTSVSHNSITMGVDRIAGDVVQIAAKLGATEIARKTVTINSTTGWGHATFNDLEANSHYGFEFYVDGALQTDTGALIQTNPTPGTPTSFTFVAGSCQSTGSNHPIWDSIRLENARALGHMGDLGYPDTGDHAVWRAAIESSLTAPRMRALLGLTPMTWTWDNHDRIIVDDGGAGSALNFGKTDPATLAYYRQLAGDEGWGVSNAGGRTWVIGRVRFIQTDNWTNKTDPDAGLVPANQQTFLGAAQKQWFKDTLEAATEPAIIWLAQWTTATTGSGRWDSYIAEKQELEAFINARPAVKARLVMIGGDSHSVQVTDGSRTIGNFRGVPSFNISGFNKSSATGQGGGGWTYDGPLRTEAQSEADWGGYSRLKFTDDGTSLSLQWDGVRVGPNGVSDVLHSEIVDFTPDGVEWRIIEWDGSNEQKLTPISWNGLSETELTLEEH